MKVKNNNSVGTIELYFENYQSDAVIELLQKNGWNWSKENQCWYNKNTPYNAQFADALLCSYLKSHLMSVGFDYDNKEYRDTIRALRMTIYDMKKRDIRVGNLEEYEAFVNKYVERDRIIIAERTEKVTAERQRKKELIYKNHAEFVKNARDAFIDDESEFWSKYKKNISYENKIGLVCNLVIKNPDSSIQMLEREFSDLKYEIIKIQIEYDNELNTSGYIIFGNEKFDIHKCYVESIIECHFPDRYEIEKGIKDTIELNKIREEYEKKKWDELSHYRYMSNLGKCIKCGEFTTIFRDDMCWDCYKDYRQSTFD